MRFTVVFGLCALLAAFFVIPQAGRSMSLQACDAVVGGCTVTSYADCAKAVDLEEEMCSQCSSGITCVNSHSKEACQDITENTPASNCVSCGTCDEFCGGTRKSYSNSDCTGTFTTSSCGRIWTDAQEGTCSVECNPE